MDSVPLVAITANVAKALIGTDAFQEADITGITVPITKHNWLVTEVDELPEILKQAFYIARTGRPGPVLVDIPKDVLNASLDFEYPETVDIPGYHPPVREEPRLKDAAQLIRSSTRPVVYLGGGVRSAQAHAEVLAFAEFLGAPVVTTVHGKGAFPETHPLCLGMFGMHGSRVLQLRGAGVPDLLHRAGGPVRRPGDREALGLRPRGQGGAPRRRPGEDRGPRRRRCPWWTSTVLLPKLHQEVVRAFEAHSRPDISAWYRRGPRLAREAPHAVPAGAGGALVAPVRHRDHLEEDGRKGGGHHRRGRASDVRRPVVEDHRAAPVHHLGRPGDHGPCLPSAIGIQLARPTPW